MVGDIPADSKPLQINTYNGGIRIEGDRMVEQLPFGVQAHSPEFARGDADSKLL